MSLRTEIENEIYELMDDLDPSGKNTERMKQLFKSFKDDKAFYRYMDKFFSDDSMNFNVAYEPFNNPAKVEFFEAVAKKHNIAIYERVFKPYLTGDTEDPPATTQPLMVLMYPIKRLKQTVFKKNHTAVSSTKRNPETGQVTGADKTARITEVEAYSLIVQEQYNAAREFYGPCSDDMGAKFEMIRRIQQDGEVSIDDLPSDPMNKTTMNTINYYMLGSCVASNFIDPNGLLLPITLKGNEERDTAIDRRRD